MSTENKNEAAEEEKVTILAPAIPKVVTPVLATYDDERQMITAKIKLVPTNFRISATGKSLTMINGTGTVQYQDAETDDIHSVKITITGYKPASDDDKSRYPQWIKGYKG